MNSNTSDNPWTGFGVGLLSLLGAIAGAVGGATLGYLLDGIAPGAFWATIFIASLAMVGALLALFLIGRFTARVLMPRNVANKVFGATAVVATLLLVGVIAVVAAEFA